LWTTFHNVLDPLTGKRQSIRWQAEGGFAIAPDFSHRKGRDIDGSALWILPALYDADAHMPHVEFGIRQSDILRALVGGVSCMNIAVRWQLVRTMDLAELARDLKRHRLPKFIPLLSVSPNAESAQFPAWLRDNVQLLAEHFPKVCKLYSNDPNLHRNLDALWAAGIKPMVWNADDAGLEQVVERAGDRPLHLRHATSAAMVQTMRRATKATIQTSPHFLLPIEERKRAALTVLPPLSPPEAGQSLAGVFLEQVDMIASDHNAPYYLGPPVTPGLQTQQQFLPALLTLCETFDWPLPATLDKATRAPAAIFGTAEPDEVMLVAPDHSEAVTNWPGQTPDRAPFEGMTLKGRVLVVAGREQVELV
jgi:dihydroorotase-like cyclic amidohydrolase